jgi:hypothetical protein
MTPLPLYPVEDYGTHPWWSGGKCQEIRFLARLMVHPSEYPEEERWWEKHKIVVWWKQGREIGHEFACGDTPEEVVEFMRKGSWDKGESTDSEKYMAGLQSRIITPTNFLYYDAESFLFGLVKIDYLHIQKWEWEPEYNETKDPSK